MPKLALDKWKNYIIACKTKGLMDSIRSQKLKICMTRIPNRTLKITVQSLKGFRSKMSEALKLIFNGFKNKSKQAFVQWQKYLEGVKNKSLMTLLPVKG